MCHPPPAIRHRGREWVHEGLVRLPDCGRGHGTGRCADTSCCPVSQAPIGTKGSGLPWGLLSTLTASRDYHGQASPLSSRISRRPMLKTASAAQMGRGGICLSEVGVSPPSDFRSQTDFGRKGADGVRATEIDGAPQEARRNGGRSPRIARSGTPRRRCPRCGSPAAQRFHDFVPCTAHAPDTPPRLDPSHQGEPEGVQTPIRPMPLPGLARNAGSGQLDTMLWARYTLDSGLSVEQLRRCGGLRLHSWPRVDATSHPRLSTRIPPERRAQETPTLSAILCPSRGASVCAGHRSTGEACEGSRRVRARVR